MPEETQKQAANLNFPHKLAHFHSFQKIKCLARLGFIR